MKGEGWGVLQMAIMGDSWEEKTMGWERREHEGNGAM
jgi:hypothetical protein